MMLVMQTFWTGHRGFSNSCIAKQENNVDRESEWVEKRIL